MPPVDWDECSRRMDECERLDARARTLEAAFRRRAERARDERDIAAMVRLRDAAHEANEAKTRRAEVAALLEGDLARAREEPTPDALAVLAARLDESAQLSRAIAEIYAAEVEWGAEPS